MSDHDRSKAWPVDSSGITPGTGPSIDDCIAAIDRAIASCKDLQDAFEAVTE